LLLRPIKAESIYYYWAMPEAGRSEARAPPDTRERVLLCLPACFASHFAVAAGSTRAAASAGLLRPERTAATAPTRVLRVPRLLLLGLRMLLLRLHERACAWGALNCMRERGWEHNTHTRVDSGCVPTMGDQAWWCRGAWFCVMRACSLTWECSAIRARIVRCVHFQLFELALMTKIGSTGRVRAARVCPQVRPRGE
jgi:hypothetical protein